MDRPAGATPARDEARAPKSAASAPPLVARTLELQRTIGNAATRTLMRERTQDRFKVVVVPDGEIAMSQAAVNRALTFVRSELQRVTGASRNAVVRRGVTVEYRQSAGDLEGIHRRLFLVYLIRGRDVDRALALAQPHLPRGYAEDLRGQAHELNSIGGTNLRIDFTGRSPSVSFASTGALAELARGRDGGDRIASQLLGEIILHELGHALLVRHSSDGIMQGRAVFDAATLGRPRHFASESATAMRERLEYLAER